MRLWTTLNYVDGQPVPDVVMSAPSERVSFTHQDGFKRGTLLKRTLAIGRTRIKFEISFIRHKA